MNKGVYEIFTTLFFLIVALIVVFLWFNVSSSLTIVKTGIGEKKLETALIKEAYDDIIVCNGQQVIAEQNIDTCIVSKDWTFIKAIKIVREEAPGCPANVWGEAQVEAALHSTENNMYSYWVVLSRELQPGVCLAEMVMVI